MAPNAVSHLTRLAEGASLALLSELGFDWTALDRNVCAAAAFKRRWSDGPAIVALLGGASSGKSTLFNSLLGREVSRISAHAHETRGPVAAVPHRWAERFEVWHREAAIFPDLEATVLEADESTAGRVGTLCLHRHQVGDLGDVVVVDLPDVTSKMSADEGSITRTLLPWFRIELELPPDASPIALGTTGKARFLIARKPLLDQWYYKLQRLLRTRFFL